MLTLNQIKKQIKALTGREAELSSKSGSVLIVQTVKGQDDRRSLLMELANELGGTYTQPNRLKATAKCSKGGVVLGNYTIIAKDTTNGMTVSQMDARTFTKGAQITTKEYQKEKVSCYVFYSKGEIEQSIINGCYDSPLLGEEVADTFQQFFKTGKLNWGPTDQQVINKLGIYVGELLAGWALLSPKKESYLSGSFPMKGRASAFYLPNDPSFSGVDSFIEDAAGNTLAISSKFDKGAAASLIANVLPTAIKRLKYLDNNTLRTLAQICKDKGINPASSAKKIVYEWGVNHYLGMGISDPYKVADSIKSDIQTPESKQVVRQVMSILKNEKDDLRLSKMPDSISSFFNNKLSERLMQDSIDSIINIVSAKNYYQFNLNKSMFTSGQGLKFSVVKAGNTQIIIKGNKAATDDINCKQGWINYEVVKS